MSTTQPVLAMYRRLLMLANRLPSKDRARAVDSIRTAFRDHKAEGDAARVEELMKLAQDKLGYLKVVTPRLPGDKELDLGAGGGRFVVTRDGEVVRGAAAAEGSARHKTFGEGNIDPDDLKRHNANMRRFHFGDRGVAPPVGPNFFDD